MNKWQLNPGHLLRLSACFLIGFFWGIQPAWSAPVAPIKLNLDQSGECLVDIPAGSLALCDGQNELVNGHVRLNGVDLLADAHIEKQTAQHLELSNIADGLTVHIDLAIDQHQWLSIDVSVENTTASPIDIKALTLFQAEMAPAFSKGAAPLKFYSDSYSVWDEEPGQHLIDGKAHRSMYMGALFSPMQPRAWMFSFAAPQLWSDMVRVEGTPGTITALVEWWNHPFQVAPGETQKFDTLYITHALNLTDALLAHAARYKPHQSTGHIKKASGYNSWEWFKEDINTSNQAPVVNFIKEWKTGRSLVNNYVLDNGWKVQYGDWSFDSKRFPDGAKGWADYVESRGMIPGVWLAPTWMTPQLAVQNEFPNSGPTQGGTYMAAVEIDPSIKTFRQNVIAQIKALRAAGIRYFKTDFLSGSYWRYTEGVKFRDSKYPPERVLREFMAQLRGAIGNHNYWLACGTVIAPCAGLVDAARIGGDIKPKWDYVLGVVHRNAARFWMHGHLWNNDQDFLIIRGEKYSKPGFIKPAAEDIPAPGFTGDEAETWCNYLVMTGGPITWSDDPQGTTPEGLEIVRRTLLHGGGVGGIPLDLQTNEMPTKWVRREANSLYIGFFNWSDQPQVVRITQKEVHELKKIKSARDILHDREFEVHDDAIEVTLAPHASICLEQL